MHLPPNFFDVAHHSQKISTQDLLDLLAVVAALVECLCDLWQIGNRIDALGQGSHAIKIRTQANMADARNFRYVVYVIDQRLQRWTRKLCRPLLFQRSVLVVGNGTAVRMSMGLLESFNFGITLFRLFRL